MMVLKYEFKKLVFLLRNDLKSLLSGVIAPSVLLVIFFFTFGNFTPIKLAVIDEDQSPYSALLVEMIFNEVSPLTDEPYFQRVTGDKASLLSAYEEGKLAGVIIVPKGFMVNYLDKKEGKITYYLDNYNTDMAKNLRLYLDESLLRFQSVQQGDFFKLELKEVFHTSRQVPWFEMIALSIFLLAFIMGSMFNFLNLLNKEKIYHTSFLYHLSPKTLLGSFGARTILAVLAGALTASLNGVLIYFLTGLNIFAFLPRLALPLLVIVLTYIFLACLIGLLSKHVNGGAVFAMILAVLVWFLSGAMGQADYAFGFQKVVANGLPNTYALAQMRAIVFGMPLSKGSFYEGWLVMLGYMISLFLAAYYLFWRKLSKTVK